MNNFYEDATAREAEVSASEKATSGGQKQIDDTLRRRDRQKSQMATQKSTPVKSDISYNSEEARSQRELAKMWENAKSDWRSEIKEESGEHPFVDVMPFVNQRQMEAKKQMKGAAKIEGGTQAKMAMEAKEMSIADQLRVSREAMKPVPKGGYDHKAIRAKQMAKAPQSRKKTSMSDAVAGKPRGGALGGTKVD